MKSFQNSNLTRFESARRLHKRPVIRVPLAGSAVSRPSDLAGALTILTDSTGSPVAPRGATSRASSCRVRYRH